MAAAGLITAGSTPAKPDYPFEAGEEYYGNYDLPGGKILGGGPFEVPGTLLFLEATELKDGGLFDKTDTPDFYKEHYQPARTLRFKRGPKGGVIGLYYDSGDGHEVYAKKEPLTLSHVTFKDGDTVLGGNLFLPAGKGPHPAVVFINGSGDTHREIGQLAPFFLQCGMAVLSYDKRGVGGSQGKWLDGSYKVLAEDALAGVKFLAGRADIDKKRIGLLGSSEGGWVAPIAGARSPLVSFMMVRVGPGQPAPETTLFERMNDMKAAGYSEDVIKPYLAMWRKIYDQAKDGASFEEMQKKVVDPVRGEAWFKTVYKDGGQPFGKGAYWPWTVKNANIDPVDYISKLDIPILWFLAEKDINVDTKASIPRLEAAFDKASTNDTTLVVLPNVGHTFIVRNDKGQPIGITQGYYDRMAAWLKARGFWGKSSK